MCANRVAVCRDHANGVCGRQKCKYYHIPIIVPPAPVMAAILHRHVDHPPPGTEEENCLLQEQCAQPGPEVDKGDHHQQQQLQKQPVAIEGTCTNSIITSEFPLLAEIAAGGGVAAATETKAK